MRTDTLENHTFLADLVSPGDMVIDLGTNHGSFALSMIARYGVRVLGVEPVPDLYAAMPAHPDLEVIEAAVTGGETEAHIALNAGTCASIVSTLAQERAQRVAVRGITLSELIGISGAARVALLKVDIEGAEFAMLDSTSDGQLLRVGQIAMEYHDFLDPGLAPDVRRVDTRLRALGFRRIAFSLDWSNVLYVNPRHHDQVTGPRLLKVITWDKYARGAVRRARTLLGRLVLTARR